MPFSHFLSLPADRRFVKPPRLPASYNPLNLHAVDSTAAAAAEEATSAGLAGDSAENQTALSLLDRLLCA